MRLSQIQSTIAGLIASVPAVGPVIVEDFTTDNTQAIEDALAARGVVVVVDDLMTAEAGSVEGARAALRASVTVYVCETPEPAHSPTGYALIEAIIGAVITNRNFKFGGMEKGDKHLTALDFTATTTVQT